MRMRLGVSKKGRVGAPKGNRNAARPGTERKYRIRFLEEQDHHDTAILDPYQRGLAIIGYLMWLESPESDENSFVEWMKERTQL